MDEITKIVEEFYKLQPGTILSDVSKLRKIVRPRQIAMYISYQNSILGPYEIGNFFKRTHGNVIHAVKLISDMSEVYKAFASELTELESKCIDVKITTTRKFVRKPNKKYCK